LHDHVKVGGTSKVRSKVQGSFRWLL